MKKSNDNPKANVKIPTSPPCHQGVPATLTPKTTAAPKKRKTDRHPVVMMKILMESGLGKISAKFRQNFVGF